MILKELPDTELFKMSAYKTEIDQLGYEGQVKWLAETRKFVKAAHLNALKQVREWVVRTGVADGTATGTRIYSNLEMELDTEVARLEAENDTRRTG